MSIFDSLLVIRLIFILGIINLVTGILIFFSCRCLPGWKPGKGLMKNRTYQRFFKYHCYIWAIFWPSVIIHATLALVVLGWPG